MNLEASDPSSLEVLDSNAMTILESMVPAEGHSAQQMVIYVQTNPQGGGQVLPMPEEIPLSSFPGVESLDPYGTSGEPIVTLVDDLGQALGEGQAVPVTLSDVSKIDFVNGGGEMFQAEDGQVLYLTYTVENGSGENSIPGDVQASSGVDMIAGLNIPSSQIQRQIVLHMGGGEGSYMVTSGDTNELSLVTDNSVPVLEIPEFKKPTTVKSKKQSVVNQTSQRKTARVVGPEVFIEDKLQVLEAIVPRLERPKKKKSDMKLTKEDLNGDFQKELCEKEGGVDTLESKIEETDEKSKGSEREEEDGLYMCDLCGASYSRAAQYYGHLHSHSGERDWNCHLCGEVFKSHSQLRRHEARSHLNMRPYPCSVCGSRFDRASQLRYHERRIHDGEKPHRCLICSKGFFKRSDLRTHVNIHLGINKSICETCGKQFNHVSNLIRHIRVHTGIKPYPCNICGRRFSQVNALQHHKDSHNTSRDFGCTLCRKQFKSNLLLKKHLRSMHTNSSSSSQEDDIKAVNQNRRYYCNVCGEDFPFSAMLKDHEVKHQKETNFHCNCCGNDYTSADEFKVHSCLEAEENRIKKDDSKRDVMNSYNELMSRITEEAAEEVGEQEPEDAQDGKVADSIDGLEKVPEIEPSLTKAQELILGMEKNPSDEPVENEENEVLSVPMKMEGDVQDSKMCSTLSVVHSGGMETSWVVESGCTSVEMHSDGKWLNARPQDESEIVIYVTPDLRHKGDIKEETHSDGAYFKKYEDFVTAALPDNVGEFSMPSVDHLDQEHDDEMNDQMTDIEPLITSTSDANNLELSDPLDVEGKKGDSEFEIVLEGNAPSVGAPKEKTKVPGKTFKCDECGKIFSKNSNYKQHLGIHFVDLQRYQCKVCGHSFAWKSTLNKHMANSHQTGPTPKFTCGFCSKEYTTSSQVQEHIKRDHFKERPHTCTECHKTFYKKYDLKIHLRTHTKEKPYICGACGKAFYHLSHIIRHERIHTGERPYKCEDCGREFNQSSTLKTHKSRHSNCSASKKKSEPNGKGLLAGDGGINPLQEGTKKSRSQKKPAAARKAEPSVDKVILIAKDPNLDFSNIPTTYEDI